MRCLGELAGLRIAEWGECRLGRRCWDGRHGNIWAPCFNQETIEEFGARFGIAESCGDAEDLQFRAAQGQRHRESVINVVADIGVNDDFLSGRASNFCRRRRTLRQATAGEREPQESQRKNDHCARFVHCHLSIRESCSAEETIRKTVESITSLTCPWAERGV